MATPSSVGATGGNPIIPLISKLDIENLTTVTLTRSVTPAGGTLEKRKASVPYLGDNIEPELVLRLVRDFNQT